MIEEIEIGYVKQGEVVYYDLFDKMELYSNLGYTIHYRCSERDGDNVLIVVARGGKENKISS